MIARINTILGLALMATPFILGFSDNTIVLAGYVGLGAIITLVSGYKAIIRDRRLWEDGLAMLAGIGLVVVPVIAGFGAATAAFWVGTLLGFVVLALAGYEIYDARVPIH